MKLKAFLFVVFYLVCAYSDSYAQLSEGGQPYSFSRQVSESIEVKEMMEIDTEMLLFEDEYAPEFEPYRFGYGFDVSYNMQNSGTWVNFPDGSKLWRLKIISRGAYSINLIYDKFWLPEGSKYFLYNNEKSMIIGAFTSRNNKAHGKFATGLVRGDEIILEYYEPANVIRTGEISISRVVHAYRDFFKGANKSHFYKITGYGDSEACNNNVHCPEAEDWQNEVRSVGLIVLGDGTRLCSGSLLNNVKENYAPYFLTAEHCLDGDIDTWVIWFNYESNTCNNPPEEPTAQTLVGASLKASNIASDFALLILDETPPSDYNVYYNGWSNINTPPTSSVVIHHPSGDIKKISFEYDQAISSSWDVTPENSHWRVTFDDGTTERGSSGAPLINQDHRVVGQNQGGTGDVPFCEYRTKWYGKFSMSWNYGGSSSSRLRDWLDPDNTGATVLDGIDNGMLSEGTLPANAIWSGSHTITGIIIVPSGITLTISNSTNITLNGYSIISTGGTITVESGATINSSNSHTRLITGSAIKGIYSTITSAMSAATSGQSIDVYGSHTLAVSLTVPPGVTLTFRNGSDITLDSHTIQKGSGSLAIESGASFTPDIRLMSGSTVLGLYTTIDDAFNNGSELYLRGEFIFNDTYTLTSGRKLVAQDGALLKYPSGKTLEIAGGATLEGNNATFTSISGTWGGLYYQENSSGSLSGCTITHATTAIRDHSGKTGQDALVLSSNTISDASYGISSLNSSTYIFYNHLTNISSRAINSGLNGTPVITFNEISNSKNGIYCSNGSTPYIYENTLSDIETYAIYCSGSNGSVVISNNELSNSGYGIMSLNVPAGSEISDNTISNASTFGLYVYNGSPLIESNAITESGLFGLYFVNSNSEMHNNLITGGSGNYAFIMYSSSPDLYYNTISTTDALWAVYANNGSDPLFGQYENYTYTGFNYMSSGESSEGVILASNASTPVMGGHIPQVWGNCKNSIIWQGTYYAAVASDGTSSIDARRCWWGQPSASACYGDVLTTYPLQSDPGSGSTLSKSSPESVIASHPEEKPGDEAAKALWEVAMSAVWEKNYTGALDDFQTLIRLYPASTYAYRALSMSVRLCREQKPRDMLTYLDELLTGVDDKTLRAVIKSRKVSEYRRMKDTKQAIALSREILAENPETIHETTALFDLFNLYDKDLADSVQAEYYLTELKTKYPEDELTGIARIDWGEDPEKVVIRKRTLPGQEEEILPEVFILGSAYPNPFNPVTRLTYSLPDAGDLVFEVVDITGRIVDRIAFSNHPAGEHHFDYTASHLSTGLYIVRARFDRQVQIRKIVYMK